MLRAALAKKISAAVHSQPADESSEEEAEQETVAADDPKEDDFMVGDDVSRDWGPVTKRPRSQRTQRANSTSVQATAAAGMLMLWLLTRTP